MEDAFWVIAVHPGIPKTVRLEDHQGDLVLDSATAFRLQDEEIVINYSIGSQNPQRLCTFPQADFEDLNPFYVEDLNVTISSPDTVSFDVTGGDRAIVLRGINLKKKQTHSGVLKSPNIPRNAMFRSGNITNRIFELRVRNGPCVNRRFYENILPSHTIYDVTDTPSPADLESFLDFTDDGQYIISFSLLSDLGQTVIIYKVSLCSYSSSLSGSSRASSFNSYATRLCSTVIVEAHQEPFELLNSTFFVNVPTYGFGIFASSTGTEYDEPGDPAWSALRSRYSTRREVHQSTRFHLIRLHDGVVIDTLVLYDDCVNLHHNHGAHLFGNTTFLLTSSRNHRVMVYEINYTGFIHTTRTIVDFLSFDEEQLFKDHPPDTLFSRPPQAQLLDSDHLLIKFGSDTYAVGNKLHAIFNMVTSEVVSFCEIEGSYQYVQSFNNLFNIRVTKSSSDIPSSSSRTRRIVDCPHLLSIRDDNILFSRAVNHLLDTFPFECQQRTPSPYLEQSRFLFDKKILCQHVPTFDMGNADIDIGWNERYKIGDETFFASRRHPLPQRFKIRPGRKHVQMAEYCEPVVRVLVHPYLPLVISSLSAGRDATINIHRP